MARQTRAEIEEALLQGNAVSWKSGAKRDSVQLVTALQRRLFHFILKSDVRLVKGLPENFVLGLHAAFGDTNDPATLTNSSTLGVTVPGPWRLAQIETEGFGGINIWGGGRFFYDLDCESLVIDGPNGSGKSSLVGALTWALRGERTRDTGAIAPTAHTASQVYDDLGSKIGDWPPLACYPQKAGELATTPSISVKLTFKNPVGQEASVERRLRNGVVTLDIDEALAFPPALVETGLMMPARLSHIRLGTGDQQLSDAVQLLTGLDEIANLGDFVADLCHLGRDFLNFAKVSRRDDIHRQFQDALGRAEKSFFAVGRAWKRFSPTDTRDPQGPMAQLREELALKAREVVGVVGADLHADLDLSVAAVQQQIAAAIEGATRSALERDATHQ